MPPIHSAIFRSTTTQDTTDNTPKDKTTDSVDGNTTTPVTEPANVLKIPELGVKMVLPDALKADDIQYYVGLNLKSNTSGNPSYSYVALTSKSLVGKAGKESVEHCQAVHGPLGVITRYSVDPATVSGEYYSKQITIGDYHYTYTGPQQPCDGYSDEAGNLQIMQADAIKNSFSSLTNNQ